MKKVTKIGNQYCHVFLREVDGQEVIVPITKTEYQDLAKKDAIQPSLEGHVWDYSVETPKYDTVSGYLEKGQYADIDVNNSVVNVGSRMFENPHIEKKYIVNDIISENGELIIEKEYKIKIKKT